MSNVLQNVGFCSPKNNLEVGKSVTISNMMVSCHISLALPLHSFYSLSPLISQFYDDLWQHPIEPFLATATFNRSQIFCLLNTANNEDIEEDCVAIGGGSLNLHVYGR